MRLGIRLILTIVVLVLLVGAGAYVVAKTGLVNVPVASAIVFTTPKPDHPVVAGTPIESSIATQVQDEVAKQLTAGKTDMTATTLSLSEQTLTAALREKLKGSTIVDETTAQAAIVGSGIELFLPLRQNGGATALIVTVTPSVQQSVLQFTVTRTSIGQLTLPPWMTSWTLEAAVNAVSKGITDAVGSYATITGVKVQNGAVDVDVTLNVLKLKG